MLTQIYDAIWHHYVPIFHQLKIIKRNVAIIHVYLLIWQLSHRGWVTHIRVSRVCYLWFKYMYYFVAFSAPSHYLNHCKLIGNYNIIKNKFQWSSTQYQTICIRENQFKNVVCLGLNTKYTRSVVTIHVSQNFHFHIICYSWWRHEMETFFALLGICTGDSPVPGKFPAQRPVTQSFDVFFDLRLNKQLSKQSWGWWFEAPLRPF